MRNLKLLFAVKSLAVGGGAERVLAQVATALSGVGHEVTVLTFDDRNEMPFYELASSIRLVRIGFGRDDDTSKSSRLMRYMAIMRRFVKQEQPDIVIGFMHSTYIPLAISLIGSGIPVIASEHIVPEHYRVRPFQNLLMHIAPHLVDGITCVSGQAKAAFSPVIRNKMTVIPNPIMSVFDTRARLRVPEKETKTLLAIGRLDAQKDHRTLIAAFAAIADQFPEWRLRIVGEGALREDLEIQIEATGMASRIELPGAISDVCGEYGSAQLFAQPSRYESYGLTVVEALSSGLPVVGFDDCIGVNELVKPGHNGLLVSGAGDRVGNLAQGLEKLMAEEQLRLRLGEGGFDAADIHRIDAVGAEWQSYLYAHARKQSAENTTRGHNG